MLSLSIPSDFNFGFEIEFKMYDWEKIADKFFEFAKKELYYKGYNMVEEVTVVNETNEYGGYDPPYYGAEIQTPILSNTIEAWKDILNIFRFIKENGGIVNERCSVHINTGIDYLGYNYDNWYNFLKIFAACEPEIYRYLCGEDCIRYCAIAGTHHNRFAMPICQRVKDGISKTNNRSLNDLLCNCFFNGRVDRETLKHNSVSMESAFEYIHSEYRYSGKIKAKDFFEKSIYGMRFEFRMPNGTLDENKVILNLYLISKLLQMAKTIDNKKMKIVDELYARDLSQVKYNEYYSIEDVVKVSNVLFDEDEFARVDFVLTSYLRSLNPNK